MTTEDWKERWRTNLDFRTVDVRFWPEAASATHSIPKTRDHANEACCTYNVVPAKGRKVAAALMMI